MLVRALTFFLCLLFSHSAFAVLSVDGSGAIGTTSATITTSNSNDVVIAIVYYTSVTTGSISGGSLTWTKRGVSNGVGLNFDEWYAIAASPLTSAVVTPSGYTGTRTMLFAVSGANTTTPYDPNVSLPATSSGGTCSLTISTSNANDLVYSAGGTTTSATITVPTGFSTLVTGNTVFRSFYKIYSSTQSNLGISQPTGQATSVCQVDAIQQAASASTSDLFFQGSP